MSEYTGKTQCRIDKRFISVQNVAYFLNVLPAPMEQWQYHRLMGCWELGSHLGNDSNSERFFKKPSG